MSTPNTGFPKANIMFILGLSIAMGLFLISGVRYLLALATFYEKTYAWEYIIIGPFFVEFWMIYLFCFLLMLPSFVRESLN